MGTIPAIPANWLWFGWGYTGHARDATFDPSDTQPEASTRGKWIGYWVHVVRCWWPKGLCDVGGSWGSLYRVREYEVFSRQGGCPLGRMNSFGDAVVAAVFLSKFFQPSDLAFREYRTYLPMTVWCSEWIFCPFQQLPTIIINSKKQNIKKVLRSRLYSA